METTASPVERRIAERLATLRAERGWSLDGLAERTGISRATLSRLERTELSPTAAMLNTLCAVYGWTLSRLMTEAEISAGAAGAAAGQTEWTDPATGYRRKAISPPAPGLRGEMVEVRLPRGAKVAFDDSPCRPRTSPVADRRERCGSTSTACGTISRPATACATCCRGRRGSRTPPGARRAT